MRRSLMLAALLASSASSAQNVPPGADVGELLSQASGAPYATAVTDLVTKSSSNSISSNLQRPTNISVSRAESLPQILLSPAAQQAAAKGYVVRDVELDPRFEANVRRVAPQLQLDQLSPPSRFAEGITIPRTTAVAGVVIRNTSAIIGDTATAFTRPAAAPIERTDSIRAAATPELDRTSNTRVFGGAPISGSDPFPESVALLGNSKICSGTLINNQTVITAAHCVCDGVTAEVLIGTSYLSPTKRLQVEKTELYRPCEDVNRDPGVGDIALIRVSEAVAVETKPIASLLSVQRAASVRAVGFGRTQNTIGFKYQVDIIIASYQCNGTGSLGIPDDQIYRCKKEHELVAAGLNRDTCGGDSGGPIYVFGVDTKVYFAGVTSRAVNPSGDCGPGGIYVLLAAPPIRPWLEARGITFQ